MGGTTSEPDFERLRRRFLLALLAGDVRASRAVIDGALDGGADADAIALGVMRPALYEVGIRWANAELTVGDEHVASATAAIALEHLAERVGAEVHGEGPPALVACVQGEQHTLGARVVADALERSGWRILYCGASTPIGDVASIAQERGARLVALSVARRALLPETRDTVAAIRERCPDARILVGGQGCTRVDDCPGADELVIGGDYRSAVRRLAGAARA
jgi:methanogenic corrinoid protein MtbC1